MQIDLRLETPADDSAVEILTRDAFWGYMSPTCEEHYLVRLMRGSAALVPELEYVAEVDGKLAGHVLYSKAKVVNQAGIAHEVLTFGPLSVLPEYRNCGVGSALMGRTIQKARQMGHRAIVFYGHPDYYPRFGFVSAGRFGITTPDGKNFDALMAMPLFEGALSGISGAFIEDAAFRIDAEAAKAYDQRFPHREPAPMTLIGVLTDRLSPEAAKAFADHGFENLQQLTTVSGREMLSWEGVDGKTIEIVNRTLMEHGLPRKLLPACPILQLAEMGRRASAITKMREKDGISLYRVASEGESFVLKVFEKEENAREIRNYELLASLGVATLPVLNKTERALLLPDLESHPRWRLGEEKDLSDAGVARALARWYRALHEKGRACTADQFSCLYDESDVITSENMARVAKKTDTRGLPLWAEMEEHFTEIRRLIDALPRTLTYNDFYWTNLVVARDGSEAFMLDFHLLGKGIAYGDIRNVVSPLKEPAKEAFLRAYDAERISDVERMADAFLSPLVMLYFASLKETIPGWAMEELNALRSGAILSRLREWIAVSKGSRSMNR